ncbi:MAG: lipopolysaccharide assembly protein LapA domain-containing protein [Acidimicrobiales bacterium]
MILIFVFQNLQHARVHFLSFSGSLPIALALLAAAGLGALAVLALGSVRILQLRRAVRSGGPSKREVSPGWQEEYGSSTSGSLLSDTATAEGER